MYHIVETSVMFKGHLRVVAESDFYWFLWIYKWLNYDLSAEPCWKADFQWHILPKEY